jgi:alkylation response protein AidB-like acyl-CoA dehydrogenase
VLCGAQLYLAGTEYRALDFALTPEQQLMQDSARRMVAREIEPLLLHSDPAQSLSKQAFLHALNHLAALGLTAARLPESAGGSGIGMLDYGIMVEQIPPAVAVTLIGHEASTSRLYADGNAEQRARLLPDFVAGKRIFCTGSTEPDTGSDPRGVRTRLIRKGKRLVLNGRKMWITNVSACDAILVTCLDGREGDANAKVIKVVVERDRSAFEAREIDTIGLKQGLLGEALFQDCEVFPENVVVSSTGATEVLKSTWAVNRPLFGLLAVGLAERAYAMALDYAKVRKQFGKPIAAHQLVQKNLSDVVTAITTSRLLCYYALSMIDHGQATEGHAAMAKRYAQNACQDAVWQAMNLFGAMGLSTEGRIEALYRDIRMIAIPDGTNEILALIHGRDLTGLEAFRGLPPPPA